MADWGGKLPIIVRIWSTVGFFVSLAPNFTPTYALARGLPLSLPLSLDSSPQFLSNPTDAYSPKYQSPSVPTAFPTLTCYTASHPHPQACFHVPHCPNPPPSPLTKPPAWASPPYAQKDCVSSNSAHTDHTSVSTSLPPPSADTSQTPFSPLALTSATVPPLSNYPTLPHWASP